MVNISLIPELRKQRKEFKASLVYRVGSGISRATQRKPNTHTHSRREEEGTFKALSLAEELLTVAAEGESLFFVWPLVGSLGSRG